MDKVSATDLMAKPALSFYEFWELLLGIPKRTAEEITRAGDGPKFFLIGRHRYVTRQEIFDWIDYTAQDKPYTPRRNNRRAPE